MPPATCTGPGKGKEMFQASAEEGLLNHKKSRRPRLGLRPAPSARSQARYNRDRRSLRPVIDNVTKIGNV